MGVPAEARRVGSMANTVGTMYSPNANCYILCESCDIILPTPKQTRFGLTSSHALIFLGNVQKCLTIDF